MRNHDLLDVIGQAQDTYILSAMGTKRSGGQMTKRQHKPAKLGRKLLVLAAALALLTMTVSAVASAEGPFAVFFQNRGMQPLDDGQLEYIQQHTQATVGQSAGTQEENGYSVQVRSALTDGRIAYITLDISAPEDVSLNGGEIRFLENPLLIPEPAEGLVLAPDGSSPDAMCDYSTVDDGDDLPNTASVVFKVNPVTEKDSIEPFDGSIQWKLHVGGFQKSTFHSETGFSDTPLGEGVWEFDLTFQEMAVKELRFVDEPVNILTDDWIGYDYTHENKLTAFVLGELNRRMELEKPDIDGNMQDIGDVSIVMKDGSKQTLLRLTPGTSALTMPIVLEEVDHILLRDGTKLYPLE